MVIVPKNNDGKISEYEGERDSEEFIVLVLEQLNMNIDAELLSSTKGFLNEDEGRRLHDIALEASRWGPCLEIGSYCGKSTIYIGTACKMNNGILFAVDHHRGSEEQQPGQVYFDPALFDAQSGRVDTFREFRRTVEKAGIEDTVVPVVSRSEVAARQWATPLSMVFIDGGHTMAATLSDYTCWSPHIMPGGYLLIHDIFEDPAEGGQAPHHVYHLALSGAQFDRRAMTGTLGVLQRKK